MEVDLVQRLRLPIAEAEKQLLLLQLHAYIHNLIHTDFNQLVQLLYTVDVDEQKLKTLLREHPDRDAAQLIAELILIRQQQKAKSRQSFINKAAPDAEERW